MYGDIIEVRLPLIGDLLDGSAQGRNGLETMVEASTGMKWADFRKLPVQDGCNILNLLSDASAALNNYVNAFHQPKK